MDKIENRLTTCFQVVFPALQRSHIPLISQTSLACWDSVASVLLLNVIEDEFHITVDLDRLPELDSFERVLEYLKKQIASS